MSPLSEQFSLVRKLQLETQFDFFRNFTGKALESAEKLITLNLDTSRASLEQSSKLVRQMIEVKDPRDLFALTGQTQSPFDSVLSYSRQLFGIAAGAATAAVPGLASAPFPVSAFTAPTPEAVAEKVQNAEVVPAPAVEAAPAPVIDVEAAFVAKPALVVEAKPVIGAHPIAELTPVAKAVANTETLKPSAASFPVKSSAQPIVVASVKPVEATPPAAQSSGTPSIVTAKAVAPGAKAARKK
jgi:phasin family protein